MSDRNGPKLSARQMSDHQVAEANHETAAENDPLAELARIVSGRSSHDPQRSRMVPAPARAPRPRPDVLGDLEAELLSDLQASFSTVNDTVAPQRPVAPRAPAEPRVEQPAARTRPAEPPAPKAKQLSSESEPLHELQARLTATATIRAERVAPPPSAGAPSTGDHAASQSGDRAASPPPQKPAAAVPQSRPAVAPPTSAERPVPAPLSSRSAPVNERPVRPAAPPQVVEPERRGLLATRTLPSADQMDIPNMQLRRTMPAAPSASVTPSSAQAPARQPHPRWEKPAEAQRSSAASRFAPPRAAMPAPTEYEAVEDELFGDGAPFTGIVETDEPDDDLPFGEFDIVPGYDDEDQLLPYADDDHQVMVKRRSGRGPLIAAIAVALVLVAGLSYIAFRPGHGPASPPPIITADGSPTKITPTDTAAPESDQNKLIYDRVASGTPASDNTTLVTPNDQPVAQVPAADAGDANNPISQVIIPGGAGADQQTADGTSSDEVATDGSSEFGRRVWPA